MKKFFIYLSLGLTGAFLHADQKITISGNDLMQFDIKEFSVTAGEKVELEFKNIGKMPKIAMGHNLVILKQELVAFNSVKRSWAWVPMQPTHYQTQARKMF